MGGGGMGGGRMGGSAFVNSSNSSRVMSSSRPAYRSKFLPRVSTLTDCATFRFFAAAPAPFSVMPSASRTGLTITYIAPDRPRIFGRG